MAILSYYLILGWIAFVTILSLWKGGAVERLGVGVYFGVWLLHFVPVGTDPLSLLYTYMLMFSDMLTALGFLVLALRYSSLWLAGAMIAQGLSTAVHALHSEDDQMSQQLIWNHMSVWLLANNLLTVMVFAMLFGGTIASWRKRRRSSRAAKESAKMVADALSGGAHLAA